MIQDNIKLKMDLFKQRGVYWLLIDLLQLYDKEHGVPVNNTLYYKYYIDKLEYDYKKLLAPPEEVKQIDLEDSINEIKAEKGGNNAAKKEYAPSQEKKS